MQGICKKKNPVLTRSVQSIRLWSYQLRLLTGVCLSDLPGMVKVIIHKVRGVVSLVEQDTIEYVSWPVEFLRKN